MHHTLRIYIFFKYLRLRKTLKYILLTHKTPLYVFDLHTHTHTHKIPRKHIRVTKVRTYGT